MLSYDADQQTVAASDYKKVYWLFDIETDSSGELYWSTQEVPDSVYDSTAYSFKILPSTFTGIELHRSKSEEDMLAPSSTNFSITNKDDTLSASDFEGKLVTIRLVISDGTLTELMGTWIFNVDKCNSIDQTLEFECVDPITYIIDGEYPNNRLVSTIEPSHSDPQDNVCLPEIFGTAYIPLRSQLRGDSSGAERFYYIGLSPRTYTITEARTPRDTPMGKSVWPAGSSSGAYDLDQSDLTIDSVTYRVYQAIVSKSDPDGAIDSNFWYSDGGKTRDLPTKLSRTDGLHPLTNPADVIAYVLEDMGISPDIIDTGGSSSFEAAETVFDSSWSLDFDGAFFFKQPREQVLAQLLNMCHATFRITDKIELHVLVKASQDTLATSDVLNLGNTGFGSFHYDKITQEESDAGHVAFQPGTNDGESQDKLIKYMVQAKDSSDNISDDTLEVPFVADEDQVKKIGVLYFQRKFLKEAGINFSSKATMLAMQPDDYLTVSDSKYGGSYPALIDSMTINHNLSINFEATKFSETMDDWGDIGSASITISIEEADGSFQTIVVGPDSTVGSGVVPNELQGRMIIGSQDSSAIYIDPSDPSITMKEGSTARMVIGYLSSANYGMQVNDSAGDMVMQVDSSQAVVGGFTISHAEGLFAGDTNETRVQMKAGAGFWAGHITQTSAPFYVTQEGALHATGVTISGGITATSGTFGGWEIQSTLLRSAASGARVQLDAGKNRMSVFNSTDEIVVMGYLEGLTRNDGVGTSTGVTSTVCTDSTQEWEVDAFSGLELTYTDGPAVGQSKTISGNTATTITSAAFSPLPEVGNLYAVVYTDADYGFWAKKDESLYIDGDVLYENGDWIIQHEASYQVKDSSGNVVIKIGRDIIQTTGIFDTAAGVILDTGGGGIQDTGGGGGVGSKEYGIFIYNTDGDQISRFHDGGIRLGSADNTENFMEYDAETGVFLLSSNSPNALTIGKGGDIVLINDDSNPAKLKFIGSNIGVEFFGRETNYGNGFSIVPDITATYPDPSLAIGYTSVSDSIDKPFGRIFMQVNDSVMLTAKEVYNVDLYRYSRIDASVYYGISHAMIIASGDLLYRAAIVLTASPTTGNISMDAHDYVLLQSPYIKFSVGASANKDIKITNADQDGDATEVSWIETQVDGATVGYLRVYATK